MKQNEIYLAAFPFGDKAGLKLRPVLLLTEKVGKIPEILVAYISSVVPSQLLRTDIVLDPFQSEFSSTNLKKVSVLRLHKLATIHTISLRRRLGKISSSTRKEVKSRLRDFLGI